MGPELVDINPRELKFTFEVKKQSSCSVQLVNKSKDYVAFKVKTTSPKRYCVRPNTGVILPHSTCDFTVTMQAARTAPPDMQLKDKFLVQSTVVPLGTSEEDILPSFFSKENGRYIEEHKLRVVLVSPPHSPVLHPINGALKQEPAYEILKQEPAYEILKQQPAYEALKQEPAFEASVLTESPSKDRVLTGVGNLLPLHVSPASEAPVLKDTPASKEQTLNGVENHVPSHVAKDVEDLRMKINHLELKLNEADKTITTLTEEKNIVVRDMDKLQQEIVLLRRKCAARVQVGFPFLFVVFIALVGVALGYLLHK